VLHDVLLNSVRLAVERRCTLAQCSIGCVIGCSENVNAWQLCSYSPGHSMQSYLRKVQCGSLHCGNTLSLSVMRQHEASRPRAGTTAVLLST
jgi:hypothetical protein